MVKSNYVMQIHGYIYVFNPNVFNILKPEEMLTTLQAMFRYFQMHFLYRMANEK